MGLQELLRYFHPMIAGVTLPGVFLVGLMAAPYVDKNPSARPENRKVANLAFTFFLAFWGILVIIGSFLRGRRLRVGLALHPGARASPSDRFHELFDAAPRGAGRST